MTHIFPRAFVFTGSPCSGKTSTLEHISQKMGWSVINETGRELILENKANGKPDPRTSELAFSQMVFERQLFKEGGLNTNSLYLLDRGIIDSIAHTEVTGGSLVGVDDRQMNQRYRAVFLFEPLPFKPDEVRNEFDAIHQMKLFAALDSTYREYGHEIIHVPVRPIEERADFVLKNIESMMYTAPYEPTRPKAKKNDGDDLVV